MRCAGAMTAEFLQLWFGYGSFRCGRHPANRSMSSPPGSAGLWTIALAGGLQKFQRMTRFSRLAILFATSAAACSSSEPHAAESERTGAAQQEAVVAAPSAAAPLWVLEDQLVVHPTYMRSPAGAIGGSHLALGFLEENLFEGAAYTFAWNGSIWVLQEKLRPPDGEYDRSMCLSGPQPGTRFCTMFGETLRIGGDTLFVGARGSGSRANAFPGAVFAYSRSAYSWSAPRKFEAPNSWNFGGALDVSGNTLVVSSGVPGFLGHAVVYVREGANWPIQHTFWGARDPAPNTPEYPRFEGGQLAISADTLALGTSDGFAQVYVRRGSSWAWHQHVPREIPRTTRYAAPLLLSGDTLVSTVAATSSSYQLRVFVRDGSGWQPQQTLAPVIPDRPPHYNNRVHTNYSLGLSEDTLVIPTDETGTPSAFVRSAAGWVQQRLPGPGSSSAAVHGGTALVGTHVYAKSGSSWRRTQHLKVSTAWPPPAVLAASAAGERAVIASVGETTTDADVYTKSDGVWSLEQRVVLPGSGQSASVSMSEDHLILSTVQPGTVGTGARVFGRTGTTWSEEHEFKAEDGTPVAGPVSLSSNTAVIGVPEHEKAHVFVRDAGGWRHEAELAVAGELRVRRFGAAVSVFGDVVVVGAPEDGFGNAYVFVRDGAAWVQRQTLQPAGHPKRFGHALSVSDDTLLVGAPEETFSSGIVYDACWRCLLVRAARLEMGGAGPTHERRSLTHTPLR